MTERDDFLREHLSPPADPDSESVDRQPEVPPTPLVGPDDTPPRNNALDDSLLPPGPDSDGRHLAEEDRRDPWPTDPSRTNTGPQRIPPGGYRHDPPPARPGEPGGMRPEGRSGSPLRRSPPA